MVWKANNPWRALDLRVVLPFSRRGMAGIDKQPKVTPLLPNLVPNEISNELD